MDLNQIKAKVFMPLTKGKVVKVDFIDWYNHLRLHKWGLTTHGYAKRDTKIPKTRKNKCIFMHRQIMNPEPHMFVDHINMNKLDNSRNNLRVCTKSQNQGNLKARNIKRICDKLKYKGVFKTMGSSTFRVQVQFNNKLYYVGCFKTQEEAALAYNKKAKELFGEFAYLNVIN